MCVGVWVRKNKEKIGNRNLPASFYQKTLDLYFFPGKWKVRCWPIVRR